MESKAKTLMNVVVFLVALLLIGSLRGKNTARVDISQENLTLSGPDGVSYTIDYDQIDVDTIELVDAQALDEPGNVVHGGENRKYRWGEWSNDIWGNYITCVIQKIDIALRFDTVDGETVVFNVESEETTQAFADAFGEMVIYYQNET